MNQHNDGGPAFPVTDPNWLEPGTVDESKRIAAGMSLRDYFAVRASETDIAVQAEIIRAQQVAAGKLAILPDDYRVTARYMHADAMLKARTE